MARIAVFLVLLAWATVAGAQHFSGYLVLSNAGGTGDFTFECTGDSPCVGTFRGTDTSAGCPPRFVGDRIVITGGMAPATPGPVALNVRLVNADANDPTPCQWVQLGDFVFNIVGRWDGQEATLAADIPDPQGTIHGVGHYVRDTPPPFQMTVNSAIDATSASATASVQFPDSVVGTSQNVYIFALAPPAVVKRAADGKDDASLPCVLAQLNNAGQLVSVSAASLQAYVSGVIASGNQAYTILNGVPTVNIGGATFFLGYGTNPSSMIAGGTNRAAVSVPSTGVACKAEKPQTGWWWNEKEGGRGFSIEARNGNLFFAGYLYDTAGQATWLAAAGPATLEGAVFQSDLLAFANGQAMNAAYKPAAPQPSPGRVTLTFSDRTHGVLSWPGGNIGIRRFEMVGNGLSLAPVPNQPESGWWWNESESGRGYFIEWQGANAFLATYLYTPGGSPIWYASLAATPDISRFTGALATYIGGQTLTGTYRAPTPSPSIGNIGIAFTGADTATLTWPGGTQVPIRRFRF